MTSNFWKNQRVFVTGCTGLLGSWLCSSLIERGADVVGLVRDFVPNSYLMLSGTSKKMNLVHGKLEDYSLIERVLNEYEVETCFHVGAQTIVTIANRGPLSTFESNIKGTWNVLEACRNYDLVERLVVASSDKAYGAHENLPYKEEFSLLGSHPYDVSKSCADLLALAYFKTYSLPVAITRFGNLFGGGDLNFNRIVPGTMRSVIFDESPIIRSDGRYTRDYVFVSDAVEGYLKLAENLDRREVKGEAFNFSNETPIDVLDLVKTIISLSGKKLEPKIIGTAKNEIRDQFLSSEKAKEILEWKPSHSLDEGLSKTFKWYSDFFVNNIQGSKD